MCGIGSSAAGYTERTSGTVESRSPLRSSAAWEPWDHGGEDVAPTVCGVAGSTAGYAELVSATVECIARRSGPGPGGGHVGEDISPSVWSIGGSVAGSCEMGLRG